MSASALLDTLKATADRAAEAETAFRRDTAQRIKALESDRAFAFRRLNLMRAVTAAVSAAEEDEDAIAAGVAALRDQLNWVGASEARTAVLDRFAEVARAVRAVVAPLAAAAPSAAIPLAGTAPTDAVPETAPPDPLSALDAFETWYADTHTGPFWALFEQYVPQNPLVDF